MIEIKGSKAAINMGIMNQEDGFLNLLSDRMVEFKLV
jgi:hypothetical protein